MQDARLLIVNRGEHRMIRERVVALGIDPSAVELVAAEHRDMPGLIARMHAGLSLIQPLYSKIASAPTKLAEYLGCGVPCLGNAGVGDMQEILEGGRVGAIVRDFSDDSLLKGVGDLIALAREPGVRERCRGVATELFSLDAGVTGYADIYRELGGARPG